LARPARASSYREVVVIAGLLCVTQLACRTHAPTPDPAFGSSEARQRSVPEAVRTHVLGGEPPLALAIRPHRWEEVAPAVERLSAVLPLGRRIGSWSTTMRRRGLLGFLADTFGGFDIPGALVRDGAAYVRFDVLGGDDYLRAARVGLPVPAPERGGTYPAAIRVRYLVPSAHTEALAEVVEVAGDDRPALAVETDTEAGFCRIDILRFAPYVGSERRAELRARSAAAPPGDGASADRSPMARRFLRARTPVAAYAEVDALRTWYLARRGVAVGTGAWRARRTDRRRWIVRGSAVATAVQLTALRSAREFETYVLRLAGDEDGGVRLVGTAARTAFGRDVWHGTSGSRDLPAQAGAPRVDGRLAADVTLGRDLRALQRRAPGAVNLLGGGVPALRGGDAIARLVSTAGAGAAIGAVHGPAHLTRLGDAYLRERLGATPSFLRLQLTGGADAPPSGRLHVRFDIADPAAGGDRRIETLRRGVARLAGRLPELDHRLEVGDDGTGRLSVALGAPVDTPDRGDLEAVEPGARMTAVPERLVALLGDIGLSRAWARTLEPLGTLPPVRVETAASPTHFRARLQMGAESPEPLRAESSEDSPPILPDRADCLDRMTAELHKYKRALPALGAADLDGATELLERLGRGIGGCSGETSPGRAEIDWMLGRASWLAGWRAEIAWRKGKAARGGERERARETAAALYRRACQYGDAAGCRARRALATADRPGERRPADRRVGRVRQTH